MEGDGSSDRRLGHRAKSARRAAVATLSRMPPTARKDAQPARLVDRCSPRTRSPPPTHRASGSSMPRAGSTSSASTPTTTMASSSRRRSTSGITIALVPTDDRRVALTLAADGDRGTVELDAIGHATGGWIDYVAGTAWAMAEAGLPTRGFRGLLASDLPAGAGLSSSAAHRARGGLGAVRRRPADARPDDPGPDRAAGRERLRRRPVRADGPVRRGLRPGRPCAAARLPDRSSTGPSRYRPGTRLVVCHSGVPRALADVRVQRPPRRVRSGGGRPGRHRPDGPHPARRHAGAARGAAATGSTTSPSGGPATS